MLDKKASKYIAERQQLILNAMQKVAEDPAWKVPTKEDTEKVISDSNSNNHKVLTNALNSVYGGYINDWSNRWNDGWSKALSRLTEKLKKTVPNVTDQRVNAVGIVNDSMNDVASTAGEHIVEGLRDGLANAGAQVVATDAQTGAINSKLMEALAEHNKKYGKYNEMKYYKDRYDATEDKNIFKLPGDVGFTIEDLKSFDPDNAPQFDFSAFPELDEQSKQDIINYQKMMARNSITSNHQDPQYA